MTTERAAPSEPATKAGRRVVALLQGIDDAVADLVGYGRSPVVTETAMVLAIEAEAAREALDGVRRAVERLSRWGVVDGSLTTHPKGTALRLDAVLRVIEEASRD